MESLSLPEMFSSMGPRFQMSMSNGGMPVLPYTTLEMSRFSQQNQEVSSCTNIHHLMCTMHLYGCCTMSQESLDIQLLNTADDSLADLEPEASDEEENTERPQLTEEQQVQCVQYVIPIDRCVVFHCRKSSTWLPLVWFLLQCLKARLYLIMTMCVHNILFVCGHTEIQRRQELCRMEYGNWWDRLHSTVS